MKKKKRKRKRKNRTVESPSSRLKTSPSSEVLERMERRSVLFKTLATRVKSFERGLRLSISMAFCSISLDTF